jgi:hypothetical protein
VAMNVEAIEKPDPLIESGTDSTTVSDACKRSSLKKFSIITLCLILLNLLACELVARFIVFLGKPASGANAQYDSKYLVADSVRAGDDNIILCGDSLMKQGIFPELLSRKLQNVNKHIRAVNLAISAGTQRDAIAYLDYIRSKGVNPRLVVFDYEVAMTGYENAAGDGDWGQSKSYLFRGILSRPKDIKTACEVTLQDMSYLVRQRGSFKHFVLDFLAALPNAKLYKKQSYYEPSDISWKETSEAGMSPEHRFTPVNDWVNQKWRISFNYDHSPQGGNFHYNPDMYSMIIKYCQLYKIPLMLVWLPHESSIYGAFWYKAPLDAGYFRQRFEEYAKEPFVFPLYLNTLPDDCVYFADYKHLNTYGCVKATEAMAEALSQPKYEGLLHDFRPDAQRAK